MLIVMRHGAPQEDVDRVVAAIEEMGYQARPMPGHQRTTVGLVGNDGRVDGSRLAALPVPEIIRRLKAAGLDSIPGGGAEILVDRVRRLLHCYGKASSDEWLDVMRHAHQAGLRTTATMMYGTVETLEERLEHMFRLRDRRERGLALAPTHEEIVTLIATAHVESYRDLPLLLYQIQTKFRDEVRPRFGLVRGREFRMKDLYSFDVDWDGLDLSYAKMFDAYHAVFRRAGTLDADAASTMRG